MNRLKAAFLLVIVFWAWAQGSLASEEDRRRMEMAAGIFPRVVAVDQNIKAKLGAGGEMVLVLVYQTSESAAQDVAERIKAKSSKIGSYTVVTRVMSVAEVSALDKSSFTAIILAERLSDKNLKVLVDMSGATGRLLMSPFDGDVEKGSMVGLFIGSRIVPWFNMRALEQAGVKINAKLLKVSRRYE